MIAVWNGEEEGIFYSWEEGDTDEVKTRFFSGRRRVAVDFDDFLPVSVLLPSGRLVRALGARSRRVRRAND